MVQIHESPSFKHSYPKQALWVYFIPSNLFLLLPPIFSLGRPLPLFVFSGRFRIPLRTGASWGLHWIWPNHRKRCWTSLSWIGATPSLSLISSFLIRSFFVLPHIQRNIRISATLIFWTCCLFVAQHSAPYIIAGLIAVL
jgi:hypothetical protein